MECSRCRHANADTARFCGDCGSSLRLEVTCPRCGSGNSRGQRFCNGCGLRLEATSHARDPRAYTPRHLADKILASRSALENERKHVTVLFADVKGSMDLAEQLDPEAYHHVMERFAQLLAEGVHRFEGTVNQYTGDGIMALFGAPIAHEDHAQRACWAALHLRDELRRYADTLRAEHGVSFSTRLGLNSGEVVVGSIGDDLRMDYTAQGHTVGLAQRMEQLAEPGTVCLTEHTARLVAGYFTLRDLGPLAVKGVRAPIHVHVLVGTGPHRTRLDVSRARGFSRFVGRHAEMDVLETALARALEGHGQVVGVVAEAGVGKSRLCDEFSGRCAARALRVRKAHAVAHGKTIPFLTLLEYLRGDLGITERDDPLAVREKVAGRLLLLDPSLAGELPLLFDLLGASDPARPVPPMDPEVRQRQLLALVRRVIHAESAREPIVAVLEDLHWNDAGSEAFLASWVEAMGQARSLVVVNFRPEYHAAWMKKSYYQQLPLLPLDANASDELLHDLLGADPSVAHVAELVRRRTGGNPFFIEEMVHGLAEARHLVGEKGAYRLGTPVTEDTLPASVQSVLAARIDRLAERDKAVLQAAAVIGKEFTSPVLRRVVDGPDADVAAALTALVNAELVYETALYPEAEYAFKHPLTQEVAYRSQLAERRGHAHQAVARALLDVHADRLDEKAAVLAHHWEAAGQPLEAARWHARAAAWIGASDVREGVRHWERVRALTDGALESAEVASLGLRARTGLLNLGWRIGTSSGDDLVAEGRAIAARFDRPGELAALLIAAGVVRGFSGSVKEWRELMEEATLLADRAGDPVLRMGARMGRGYASYLAGGLTEALEWYEAATKLLPEDPWAGTELYGFVPRVALLHFPAYVLHELGRLDEARRNYQASEDLARKLGAVENLGWTLGDWGDLEATRGDVSTALDLASRGLQVAEKVGTTFSRLTAALRLAEVQNFAGHYAEAVSVLEGARAMIRESGVGIAMDPSLLGILSQARLALGEAGAARAAAEEAIATAERYGTTIFAIRPQLALAQILLRCEGARGRVAIEAALDRATALGEQTGVRRWQPWVHLTRVELAELVGDEARHERELREARRVFEDIGATPRAEQLMVAPVAVRASGT